jgi:hypothetical protein
MEICERCNATCGIALFIHLSFFFNCIFTGKKDDFCVYLSHARPIPAPFSSSSHLFLLLSSSSSSLVGDNFEELGLKAIEKGDERDWA